MKREIPDLNKALAVLLYDQYDSPDVFESIGDEEMLIEHIIYALIEKNGNICPFKNYDCIEKCEDNMIGCAEGLQKDCDREYEDVWRDFIFSDKSEEE